MPKIKPEPGWSRYTPHSKSNPSNLPPELQDPEFVAEQKLKEEVELEKRRKRLAKGEGSARFEIVDTKKKEEVIEAIKAQINSSDYLFTSLEEVLSTLSMELYKAAIKFKIDKDDDIIWEVKRRFAEVKARRLMEASKDSRNFTTIYKAMFADDDKLQRVTPSFKPKTAAEKSGGIKIEMVGGLTEEDRKSALDSEQED